MGYTLKPDLNLDVYAEPFAASGRYYDYGELLEPSSLERIPYGAPGTPADPLKNRDFNVQSFQSNVVLRWEWRAGSTMYLVWQQNRDARYPYGTRVGIGRHVQLGEGARQQHLFDENVVLDSREIGSGLWTLGFQSTESTPVP